MVNEEHYARLKESVQAWNEWRAKNLGIITDFIGANLSNAHLSGANLIGANLIGANLSNAHLSGARLMGANLSGAVLSGANLSNTRLNGANLSNARLSNARLSNARFSEACLSNARLSNARFSNARFSETCLSNARLNGANLQCADLRGLDFRNARLIRANLIGAYLNEANLKGAYLNEANLSNARLIRANLSGANLSGANLSGANLSGANLSEANLNEANLSGANLSGANLNEANLSGANLSGLDLSGANFIGANLSGANLSGVNLSNARLSGVNLSGANLSGANLMGTNLSGARLMGANLSGLDFIGANLSGLDLSGANLIGAKLIRTQVLGTDFTGAKFTSAYLEDWNINSATKLNDIDCQYVYLRSNKQERCPSSGEFAPGEFTKVFQKVLETVDLIFRNGVDWEALAYSFIKIQIENESSELTIRSIEVIDDIVLVKVNISKQVDKTQFHSDFFKGYEFAKKELEPQFQARLGDKDKEINRLFLLFNQANDKLGEVPKIMAEQPKVQQNFHASVYGVAGNVEGDFKNYPPEQRQNLAEAAAEIQQLLNQLAQTNPTTDVVTEAIHQKIKTDPTFKARLLAALKAGGLEALKAIFNHPAFSIPAETIKGFLEAG